MMAEIYDVDVRTINEHIQKIFHYQELSEDSVIRKYRITTSDVKDRLYQSDFNKLIQELENKEGDNE